MRKNLKEMIVSDLTKDFIQQAMDQDFNKAGKVFGEIMNIKMSDTLEQEKIRMSNMVYNGGEDADLENDDDVLGDEDGTDQLELDLDAEDGIEEGEEEIEDETDDELPLDPEE